MREKGMRSFHPIVAKFYVTSIDEKYLAYVFGTYEIFLEGMKQASGNTSICTVSSEENEGFDIVMEEYPELNLKRIMKHGYYLANEGYPEKSVVGLAANTAKNILGILDGHGLTIRISSNNRQLRQMFYDRVIKFNKDMDTDVEFDFDEYDLNVHIRETTYNNGHYVIVWTEGEEMSLTDILEPKEVIIRKK
jgi:hypothetical protein